MFRVQGLGLGVTHWFTEPCGDSSAGGSFTASVQQLCNVATLPGVLSASVGMPDLHSGYGFAIGNVAAMDMNSSEAVVSPGGVGFDINCGVSPWGGGGSEARGGVRSRGLCRG